MTKLFDDSLYCMLYFSFPKCIETCMYNFKNISGGDTPGPPSNDLLWLLHFTYSFLFVNQLRSFVKYGMDYCSKCMTLNWRKHSCNLVFIDSSSHIVCCMCGMMMYSTSDHAVLGMSVSYKTVNVSPLFSPIFVMTIYLLTLLFYLVACEQRW